MDYEKKYKEALQKIRELIERGKENGWTIISYEKDFEEIFPELAENRDERIRKALIKFHKSTIDIDGIKGEQIIAWLEKQGESYTKKDLDDAYLKGVCDTKQELEKQGNKETLCDKCRKEQPSHSCQEITANGRCYIESMNTSNNVKPKFKVGDILKHNKANIVCKVLSANVGFYSLISILGGDEMELSNVEKNFHLWTIKDAKDGDVLQLGTVTAIFKKYIGQEKCICYCSIDENGVFEIPIEDGEDNIYGCTNTTPATKEQRALLFQKMNEEGYEWNAELKKVYKITTPADVGFEELGKAWAEEANKQSLANSAKTCKKSQRMISAEAKEALYDKPAWSEEDEEYLRRSIKATKEIYPATSNWLKSIKQRIKGE